MAVWPALLFLTLRLRLGVHVSDHVQTCSYTIASYLASDFSPSCMQTHYNYTVKNKVCYAHQGVRIATIFVTIRTPWCAEHTLFITVNNIESMQWSRNGGGRCPPIFWMGGTAPPIFSAMTKQLVIVARFLDTLILRTQQLANESLKHAKNACPI